jgi:hypothetical protein
VSLLNVQGGMFLTQGMAGNNKLGGQDFNQRLHSYLKSVIKKRYKQPLTDKEDLQTLRLAVEEAICVLGFCLKKSCINCLTFGILVEPPTNTISSISSGCR